GQIIKKCGICPQYGYGLFKGESSMPACQPFMENGCDSHHRVWQVENVHVEIDTYLGFLMATPLRNTGHKQEKPADML
ncbi:hypothetical protein ACQP3L_39070, partial [Escherichia coli]